MSLCRFVSTSITVAKFIYVDYTDRQVRLQSIKTIVLHLQMDFVKFRFNKCTSTSSMRHGPQWTPRTSTHDPRTSTTRVQLPSPRSGPPSTPRISKFDYHRRKLLPERERYFLYRRRVQLLPLHHENVYFPRRS